MPLDLATFLVRFPYFSKASSSQVQACLDEAHASYSGCADFPQYHGIVGNHAAHLLASEPGGHTLRINKTGPETTYSVQRDALLRQCPTRACVIP